jgi:hypothetical protein
LLSQTARTCRCESPGLFYETYAGLSLLTTTTETRVFFFAEDEILAVRIVLTSVTVERAAIVAMVGGGTALPLTITLVLPAVTAGGGGSVNVVGAICPTQHGRTCHHIDMRRGQRDGSVDAVWPAS